MKCLRKRGLTILYVMFIFLLVNACSDKKAGMRETIEKGLERATTLSLAMAQSLENDPGLLPKTFEEGELVTSDSK